MDVIEGGGSERAGLRGLRETNQGILLGDVIIAIEGDEIGIEDDLLNAQENHRAGDVVTVTTRRDSATQTYEIELQGTVGAGLPALN